MNGQLGIGDVSIGYSKEGVNAFVTELNSKAITQTAELLSDTTNLLNAFRAGWQGQSEIAFEKNLNNAIKVTADGLNELRTTMEAEFDNIGSAFNDFDNKLLTEEE